MGARVGRLVTPVPMSSAEVSAFADQQRRQAAYVIAAALPRAAKDVMSRVARAATREEADIARNRAIAFGVMLDQLAKMTNQASPGRYGGHGGDEVIDQASVLLALPVAR